ncbi:hypothetical protein ASD11_09325 [Aeromicrobium sp. Root495]|uniref:DNA glycosylase AlkZ-like family protein n=1 Tax=Aeromicrobium sp. Root495 TaxID=1736550 RepID=UPI0007004264|nr:crosslink repair DNA glycosylase YcaQ family protein [Aeromicrobium sp. Root495]KQY59728.1 hypothetical protein ASD11_09325 [Aeromicrobium sp. Root495]
MRQALAPHRLPAQLLTGEPAASPTLAVGHLGAVQCQDHVSAAWSIGRRCGASAVEVAAALSGPDVVRTHVLRTTWHHVLTEDLPHLVAATGARVERLVVTHTARQGLPEDRLRAAADVVARAVEESPGCTRAHLAERLHDAGHAPLPGDLLAHVVMMAELDGRVGGSRLTGGQHRYRPLSLAASALSHDEALAWVARTYARGHGPHTAHDLAWWTSLTLTQARRAIELAQLRPVTLDGRELWVLEEAEPVDVPPVLLLANFDEIISYVRDAHLRAELGPGYEVAMRGFGLLFLDGRLAGGWTRTVSAATVEVHVTTHATLSRRHRAALDTETEHFAGFLGLEGSLRLTT